MNKRVLIYENGYRSVSVGKGITIGPSAESQPIEEVDVTAATDEQFELIKTNPIDNHLMEFTRKSLVQERVDVDNPAPKGGGTA